MQSDMLSIEESKSYERDSTIIEDFGQSFIM
jgi:hypothetical protein